MYYDLSKADKRTARSLIDKALNAQFKAALDETQNLLEQWQASKLSNRDAYLKLYQLVQEHDGRIANRYDGLGGSRYLLTVMNVLAEGWISKSDIENFSDNVKESIEKYMKLSS